MMREGLFFMHLDHGILTLQNLSQCMQLWPSPDRYWTGLCAHKHRREAAPSSSLRGRRWRTSSSKSQSSTCLGRADPSAQPSCQMSRHQAPPYNRPCWAHFHICTLKSSHSTNLNYLYTRSCLAPSVGNLRRIRLAHVYRMLERKRTRKELRRRSRS